MQGLCVFQGICQTYCELLCSALFGLMERTVYHLYRILPQLSTICQNRCQLPQYREDPYYSRLIAWRAIDPYLIFEQGYARSCSLGCGGCFPIRYNDVCRISLSLSLAIIFILYRQEG